MSNEKDKIVRRVIVRCRSNRTQKWSEYVFPTGSEAADFWNAHMDLYPTSGQAKMKNLVDAEPHNNNEADSAIWWEPQLLPAPTPSQPARDAETLVKQWIATLQNESHVTDEDAEDLVLRIIAFKSAPAAETVGEQAAVDVAVVSKKAAEEIDKMLACRLPPHVYIRYTPANQEIAALLSNIFHHPGEIK